MRRSNSSNKAARVIFILRGLLAVIALALRIAPFVGGGLSGLLRAMDEIQAAPLTLRLCENSAKTIFLFVLLYAVSVAAFADGDPLTVVNNLSDFIFGLIRAVGIILLGWGIVQVGLSLQSHDPIWVLSFVMILTVYGRFFKMYIYAAIAPIPLAAFAGEPSRSIGISFVKSYAAVCLEGAVIVLACVVFSAFASAPPVVSGDAAVASMVWSYIGELIFNMLILVGCVKIADRLVHEMMGL